MITPTWNLRGYDQTSGLSSRECVSVLLKLGFYVARQTGSHIIMRREDPFAQTVVPNHKEVRLGTTRAIVRNIGLTVDEFVELLK
jgi:predicted RNA binding protein YcfA (HicA-like mRNA interferase family)